MSIIIFGPQGCGKTKNADTFCKHFGCTGVIDNAEWPKGRDLTKFKAGNELWLITADEPDVVTSHPDHRRIYSYDEAWAEVMASDVESHPLYPIFMAAIGQAMHGKGERHGGNTTPFLEQPWVHYSKMHGRGFLTGQASKKLEEAAHQRDGEGFETEVLGAIVYAGMSILKERGEV